MYDEYRIRIRWFQNLSPGGEHRAEIRHDFTVKALSGYHAQQLARKYLKRVGIAWASLTVETTVQS